MKEGGPGEGGKMKVRSVVVPLFAGPMLYLGVGMIAQAPRFHSAPPRSPISSGVLMARAIQSGRGAGLLSPDSLTCSPAPCVLTNVQASEGGNPVSETPITANPRNTMQLLTGGYDFNCSADGGISAGFYASAGTRPTGR